MSLGRQVIVQGAFLASNWRGRPDVLLRVETPSSLGDWSYEVVDTKLSRETKGGTILQLSLYSDLLGKAQGLTPQWFHVIAPWSEYQPQTFRTDDFAAYYRRVRASLEQAAELDRTINVYPDPKPFCEVCRWQERCDAKRHADDHLSLVAGIRARITRRRSPAQGRGAFRSFSWWLRGVRPEHRRRSGSSGRRLWRLRRRSRSLSASARQADGCRFLRADSPATWRRRPSLRQCKPFRQALRRRPAP
jgi:PD-(D/E)XK nuclease superfamily